MKINDKWGYVNKTGKVIIKPIFDGAGEFNQGLARVVQNGKAGYINRKGHFVIEPLFEDFNQKGHLLLATSHAVEKLSH